MTTPRIGLFVTCLVDIFRPNVAFSALKLLEQNGYHVEIPSEQTCCGQVAYNSGDVINTRAIAKQVIDLFKDFDYIVVPSGSCTAMFKQHYPELFLDDPDWHAKALSFSKRCYELLSFLTDICDMTQIESRFEHTVTYHDSCAGLRQLGIYAQPRQLLESVKGLTLTEMTDSNVCCGFGGIFSIKYPEISTHIVSDKIKNIQATQADVVLGGDMGCLLNISGRLKHLNIPIKVYHIAEVLAEMSHVPAIGDQKTS